MFIKMKSGNRCYIIRISRRERDVVDIFLSKSIQIAADKICHYVEQEAFTV